MYPTFTCKSNHYITHKPSVKWGVNRQFAFSSCSINSRTSDCIKLRVSSDSSQEKWFFTYKDEEIHRLLFGGEKDNSASVDGFQLVPQSGMLCFSYFIVYT